MVQKLFKAYSIVPTAKRKDPVRVDWRCYAFKPGRRVGLLTEEEACWLSGYLKERHGISLIAEEYCENDKSSKTIIEELEDFEDLELIPVRLHPPTNVEFSHPIFGYVISFPLDNVSSVDELLNIIETKDENYKKL